MSRKPRQKSKAYNDPHFNKVALILGHICLHWSRIEDVIDYLIGRMVGLEENNQTYAITSNMDIRNKIQTLKALAFERKTSMRWFDKVAKLLDEIDNTIRPERNRYVHSKWVIPQGKLTRVSRRIRFKKSQAFKEITLSTEEALRINLRNAQRFCSKVERAWLDLFIIFLPPHGGPPLPSTPEQQSDHPPEP